MSWAEARARAELLEISIDELAHWASTALVVRSLGEATTTHRPGAGELAKAMAHNPHLFQRIALQFAASQHPPANGRDLEKDERNLHTGL